MTKIISISDRAYNELKMLKNGFSFSEIIITLAKTRKKDSIMEFAGKLGKEEGKKMAKEILSERKISSWRMK